MKGSRRTPRTCERDTLRLPARSTRARVARAASRTSFFAPAPRPREAQGGACREMASKRKDRPSTKGHGRLEQPPSAATRSRCAPSGEFAPVVMWRGGTQKKNPEEGRSTSRGGRKRRRWGQERERLAFDGARRARTRVPARVAPRQTTRSPRPLRERLGARTIVGEP